MPKKLATPDTLAVAPGEVVLIGSVRLEPPLDEKAELTRYAHVIGDGRFLGRVFMSTSERPVKIEPGRFDGEAWSGYIDARWGETFVVRTKTGRRYLNGLAVPLDFARQEFFWFPGEMVVEAPENAGALCTGTLVYVRNQYNEIVNIRVEDNCDSLLAAVREKYPGSVEATRALWFRQLPWQ